jgi:hypothetical protein
MNARGYDSFECHNRFMQGVAEPTTRCIVDCWSGWSTRTHSPSRDV